MPFASPLDNIRERYQELVFTVRRALLAHVGDAINLGNQRDRVAGFLQAAEQVLTHVNNLSEARLTSIYSIAMISLLKNLRRFRRAQRP